LRIEKILKVLVEEIEEREKTSVQKQADSYRKLGFVSLGLLFGLCFGYVFYLAVYYKFLIFGTASMTAIGLTAIVFLGLLSLYFFTLPKLLNRKKTSEEFSTEEFSKNDEIEEARITEKLLSEGNFQPLPKSVTENSTEILLNKRKPISGDL
jgi:hypothetical protein